MLIEGQKRIREEQAEKDSVVKEEEVMDEKEEAAMVNAKFSPQKMTMSEQVRMDMKGSLQLKLTNRLHQLASRLQITYHDLVAYLSRDGSSISERADYINVRIMDIFEYSLFQIVER